MNNFCRNCGQTLSEGINFCDKCGTKIIENRVNVEEVISTKKNEKNVISILITLFGLSIISYYYSEYSSILDFVTPLLFFISIITLITARIKMEYSKNIRMLFNIIIVAVSLIMILILYYMIICEGGIRIV